jgi:predicted unusual protein kinase regulating ubiquinone biosynthesis (AarF/ABC1/UbiB family)
LVSDWIEGERFDAFLARADPAERSRAGLSVFRFYLESFCTHGVFNADPHPGNYLFANDEVTLLDFGCVKRMTAEQVDWWQRFLRAYLERDFELARRLVIQMDMVPDPDRYDFEYHHRMVLSTYEFALHAERFRFDRDFMRRMLRARGRDNPGKFRVNVPKDWIFANRMVLGLFALMARLGAEADFRGALLDLLYEPGQTRPAPYSASELAMFINYRRPRGRRRSA